MKLCSGLDAKWHGKRVVIGGDGKFKNVATGRGVALGEAPMEQDRVYFEIVFDFFVPKKSQKEKPADVTKLDGEGQAPSAEENIREGTEAEGPTSRKLFTVGVAVKSSIKRRTQLSDGQLSTIGEDDKNRWIWTWGPDILLSDGQQKGRHVIGCAYDQSTGSGNIVLTMDGKFAYGPLPRGLRGIKGTCFPAIELLPPADSSR